MATMVKDETIFSEYPTQADNYFLSQDIVILGLPTNINKGIEARSFEVKIKNARQYIEYIKTEIQYWEENDPDNFLKSYSKYDKLVQALTFFNSAIDYYKSSNISYGNNYMGQSVNNLSGGHVCSKTKLAKALIKIKDKGANFIIGFMASLSNDRNQALPSNINSVEGFITGLQYTKVINKFLVPTANDIKDFSDNVKKATENYTQLNADYTEAFYKQREEIKLFSEQIKDQTTQMKNDADSYFAEKEKRCNDLELLYEEKLKLEAPANYWEKLEHKYSVSGRLWFGISILFTGAIIFGLILILQYLPGLFSEDSHWIDIFKNSAIITVITSIAVYILRLFVKMTVSSFHLSRDAKERNSLTYFYLSLIEKKAVTEKERAIILNSLFSRADTGLLKGDSSPTMSGNITDLVKSLGEK